MTFYVKVSFKRSFTHEIECNTHVDFYACKKFYLHSFFPLSKIYAMHNNRTNNEYFLRTPFKFFRTPIIGGHRWQNEEGSGEQ